jgi:hypothetical protein
MAVEAVARAEQGGEESTRRLLGPDAYGQKDDVVARPFESEERKCDEREGDIALTDGTCIPLLRTDRLAASGPRECKGVHSSRTLVFEVHWHERHT